MALSLSSDFSINQWNVFLSFRGKDTRRTFTGHLYTALKQAGIRTFMDDSELPRGEEISEQLLKAIQGSEISLVIFSANYASSPWCLNELVEILECKQKMGQLVYPVFYNVSPAVVRHITESYSSAFETHEKRYVSNLEKVDNWKAALTQAANLSGYELQNDADGHEARLIHIIVKQVLLEVNLVGLNVAKEPVGIESRVEEITQLLSIGSNDIQTIGMCGMGGIGKTTIAKALFNKNFRHFEGSCFLANVREASERHDGITHLQEQLLSEILVIDKIRVENEDKGISLLMERLCSKKVLIVLDDLNNRRQFDYLTGQWNKFALGSRIIITTRDTGLLEQIEVDKRYNVDKLNDNESLELFCRHAFRKLIPSDDYMEITKSILSQAGGLPLALEVLGCYLFKRSMSDWRSSLTKLQQIPRNEIQKKLFISYHALYDANLQDVFLDIACYFIGEDKDMTISILNSWCFDSENKIIILMERCLLSVNDKNELRMHDLLREMGRDIARNHCPEEPWKHSRLWSFKDICNVLHENKGGKCIECIMPYRGVFEVQTAGFLASPRRISFETSAFKKLHKLRLLCINCANLSGGFEGMFEELRWLSWRDCPLKILPIDFNPKKLVFLYLQRSNFMKLWKGHKCLEKLKILNVSDCKFLTTTPDFSGVPCIEDLNLSGCKGLVEIDPSIGHLVRLVNLNLMGCMKLKCLPSSLRNLTALKRLDLDGCSILEELPDIFGNMRSLSMLRAGHTSITTLPESIGCLNELVMLKLNNCKNLRYLPSTICNLRKLEHLILSGYSDVELLPFELGKMESLRLLSAEYTAITSLPASIGYLSKVSKLLLHSCAELRYLPSSICNLRTLECLNLNYCTNLQELPDNIGNMDSLRMLWAEGTAITTLPESTGNLNVLVELVLSNCKGLISLPSSICNLRSLECLDLSDCSSLEGLPEDIGKIKSLRALRACTNKFRKIPNSARYLKNLEILVMQYQSQEGDMNYFPFVPKIGALLSVSDSIACLSSLQHLNLSGNHFSRLTPSLGQLYNLKTLTLTGCRYLWAIPKFPPNLNDLYAEYCTSIETLDLSNLNHLRCLHLSYCSSLVKILGLDKLESVTRIDMAGCDNLSLTFEESLFQALSVTGRIIYIYIPLRDVPCWFMHQVPESSEMLFHTPQTVLNACLGIIVWLNIGHSHSHLSGFGADIRVNKPHTTIGGRHWSFETSSWKPVPQSWIILIPQAESQVEYGDHIGVSVNTYPDLESIGGHLMYV